MIASLLGVIFAGSTGQPATAPPSGPPIVVTGVRLGDSARQLRECLERRCPPNEDIAATLAHVENLFLAGDYSEARRTVRASTARNQRNAPRFPVPVSMLYRATARLSTHLGERQDFVTATYGIRRALLAGLPKTDPQVVGSGLEIGDMKAKAGDADAARRAYLDVEDKARRIGRPDLVAYAQVRRAGLSYQVGNHPGALALLGEIARNTDPKVRASRLTALVLLARIDREAGRQGQSDRLIAEVQQTAFAQPILLYAPPLDLDATESEAIDTGSGGELAPTQAFENKWVDVGFWVEPNGRVTDLEILRTGGATEWAAPVLESIKGRIYSSTASDSAAPGAYRVERYTYTSHWTTISSSRLRQRSAQPRIEFLDLTATPRS